MMRLLLRDYDCYAKIASFDVDSCQVMEEVERNDPKDVDVNGVYLLIENQLVAFFRNDDRMNLAIGGNLYQDLGRITCKFTKAVTWLTAMVANYETIAFKESKLDILCDGAVAHVLTYTPVDRGIPAVLDFTNFDWEDFDFLLFLRNVLSDPERRDRCFRPSGKDNLAT